VSITFSPPPFQPLRFAVAVAAWLVWMIPFFRTGRGQQAQTRDRRARWGIALEAVGFMCVWSGWAWARDPGDWRWAVGVPLLAAGGLLSWTSAVALGKQWRFDAALNADHELVQRGAYRVVRHPIYASMLAMLLGTGFLVTRLGWLAVGVVFFVAGTEVRVHIEEALLTARFGAQYDEYRRRVSAYVPFVR
jgi:protein-S-isoprenylcysteine O-methyltransferase Ste14